MITLGVTLTAPRAPGRAPFDAAPPSIESETVPAKAVGVLFGVLNDIVPVPVCPVDSTAMTRPEPLLEKSRATPPMFTATG